jgi:NAD(P)-dependent dehydrogenase (short-subunit alcohol dehydrogenase family)
MSASQEDIPLKDLISLAGRNAIVTGGASGIGSSITRRLAEAGASTLIADTDAEAAAKTMQIIEDKGHQSAFIECDISREGDVRSMVSSSVSQLGSIDILVNNAGIYPRKPFIEMTGEDFERVIAVNLLGAFLCSRYASLEMIKNQKGGCIINIASIDALHPSSTGMSAYDASKGGVVMLTKSLARELGPHDIRVNAIAPGAILTRAIHSHIDTITGEEERAQLKELKAFMSRMALGRMGDADDVARVVLFLASELASYITGDLIVVDGGYLIS